MGHIERHRDYACIRNAVTTFFAALCVCFTILTFNALAITNVFKVQSVELGELSATASGDIGSFDDSNIVSNVTFHKVGDIAEYVIVLKNTDTKEHVIESITDDNMNAYVDYEYDANVNKRIGAGDSFTFVVTAKYARSVSNVNERAQAVDVKFNIRYLGAEGSDVLFLVPDTGNGVMSANVGDAVKNHIVPLVVSTCGLIVCAIAIVRKHKRAMKIVGVLVAIVSLAAITATARAVSTRASSISIGSVYNLHDKLVISYVANGTNLGDDAVGYGETIESLRAAPEVDGYTADGWKLESGSAFDAAASITEDVTLFAAYTANHYNVVFDGNGATSGTMQSQEYVYDQAAKLRKNSYAKDGFNFVGWNTLANGEGTSYEDEQSVSNLGKDNGVTVTLYAQWERKTLTINLHGNGLQFDDDSSMRVLKYADDCHDKFFPAAQYSRTSNIDEAGETDDYYSDNLQTKDVITIPGASSLHVTIKYATEEYWDMLYVFQGEYTGSVSRNMSAGQLATYQGHEGSPATVELDISGDTATFAFYSDSSYGSYGYFASVAGLDANGDAMGGETRYVCERDLVSGEYAEPVYDDQTQYYYGWSLTADGEPDFENYNDIRPIGLNGELGETLDLYAFWFYIHTVHFDANGGEGWMYDQQMAGGYSDYLYDNEFYRDGYEFLGWSTDKDATVPEYENYDEFDAPNNADGTTLYAVWNKLHTIVFNANGGSGQMYDQYVGVDETIYLYQNDFSREHYTFLGWSTDKDATDYEYDDGEEFTAPSEAGETILYAVWAKQHQITFNANGGEGEMADQWEPTFSVAYLNANSFTREHYTFIGWSEDPDSETATYNNGGSITIPDETGVTNLYAVWKADYVITFNANGGTGEMEDLYVPYNGSKYLPLNTFTRENYEFIGWSEDPDSSRGELADGNPTVGRSMNLYAIWKQYHRIIFDANGGEGEMADQYIKSNTSANLNRSTFTREGYIQLGWAGIKTNVTAAYADGASFYAASKKPNETTLYAIWAKPYSISFDANGGEGDMTGYKTVINQVGDKGVLVASNYSRAGYGFLGWSADPDAGSKANNANPPKIYGPNETITMTSAMAATANADKELILYATWLEKDPNYTLQTFDKNAFSDKKVVALEDARDGEVYAVGKQADDSWWMIENLRLNPSRSDVTINASNTNNPTSTFVSQIAGYKGKPVDQTYFVPTFPSRYDTCNSKPDCFDHVSYGLGNITREYESSPTAGSQEASWYSYGVVYNYYTATAGHGTYGNTTPNVTGDICPSNWRLPEGNNNTYNSYVNEIMKLGNIMAGDPPDAYFYGAGDDKAVLFNKYPMNIVFSGIYGSNWSTPKFGSYRGKAGIYTTNYHSTTMSGELYIQAGSSYYGNTMQLRKFVNKAVRCVAK